MHTLLLVRYEYEYSTSRTRRQLAVVNGTMSSMEILRTICTTVFRIHCESRIQSREYWDRDAPALLLLNL